MFYVGKCGDHYKHPIYQLFFPVSYESCQGTHVKQQRQQNKPLYTQEPKGRLPGAQ